ncbi:MAG TPA: hypothetical protein PLY68_10470, partial [Myxococcota bacterium]|nr:hypothetical protein [Myxococcota bacterium]
RQYQTGNLSHQCTTLKNRHKSGRNYTGTACVRPTGLHAKCTAWLIDPIYAPVGANDNSPFRDDD